MGRKEYTFETLCGRAISIVTDKPENYEAPESLCLVCPENNCAVYTDYLYEVTHYNNPR